jgi:hypothetical protein
MLTWSSTNATACTASGGWTGALATSGSKATAAITASTTYTITCTGDGGTSTPVSATVSVTAPAVALTANPSVIAPGQTTVLTWTTGSGTTACTAGGGGGFSGSVNAAGGNQTSAALSANTTFTLSCDSPSGTSTASAAVTVTTATMSATPSFATLTAGSKLTFTASVPGGGAATWTAVQQGTTTACTSGTIDATSGVFTAGTTGGVCTITATSAANSTQTAVVSAAVTDLTGVYTYHNDLNRDGANTHEFALTKSTVTASRFGKLTSCAVDGAIFAQPLWVANVTMGDGKPHNVVYVATQNDSVYAFDADAVPCGAPLAQANLLDSAHGGTTGETAVLWNLVGQNFGDIQWQIGVTGTPVIDPASKTLFVVAKSNAGSTFFQRLHALDLTTLKSKTGSPTVISGSVNGSGDGGATVSFTAQPHNQRPGLAFANGTVYIAWASHDDFNPAGHYHGWVMGYKYNGSAFTQSGIFNVTPNDSRGGIWMAGGAPAADAAGNIYLVTGNGQTHSASGNLDESLVQFNSTLGVTQSFTPSNPDTLNQTDSDFGASGAVLLADLPAGNTVTHVVIASGKNGTVYVLNRDLLGGAGDQNAVQSFTLGIPGDDVFFTTPVFWNNRIYLAPTGLGVTAYPLNTTTANFDTGSSSATTHTFAGHGTVSSLSANAASNGILWSLDVSNYCTKGSGGCGSAVLYAHDASNLATELYNSTTNGTKDAAGNAVKFAVPTVANGHVYVGTRGNNTGPNAGNTGGAYPAGATAVAGELDIYGIKQ